MGDERKKRSRGEKEARKVLKKLRKSAEKTPETQREEPVVVRRVYGPSRPPQTCPSERVTIGPAVPDFLADRVVEEEKEEEIAVGPELPDDWDAAFEGEVQGNGNEEVERILSVLKNNAAFLDPYDILGISPSAASDGSVKKAYWRCSLSVHPDKSSHPQAQKAFQALNQAWKEVKSVECREAVERKRQGATFHRQAEMEAKKKQRQQEWSHVRHSGGEKGMHGPQGREEWMTQLPELRRKPTAMKQVNQTSFSRKEYVDLATNRPTNWTQMPETRTGAPMGPSLETAHRTEKPHITRRGVSLMEKHQAKQKEGASKKSKSKQKSQGSESFQYRPFDRERDLEMKGRAGCDLGSIGSLRSRFG